VELMALVLASEVLGVEEVLDVEGAPELSAPWSAPSKLSRSLLSVAIGAGSDGAGAVADVLLVETTGETDALLELEEVEEAA
jgi:hypothetical protein